MNQYLVDIALPSDLTEEFVALIPQQREQIDELMANGSIASYSLSLDRSKAWAVVNAESEEEVMELLDTMPLIEFMDPTVYELAFHNVAGSGLPAISLN